MKRLLKGHKSKAHDKIMQSQNDTLKPVQCQNSMIHVENHNSHAQHKEGLVKHFEALEVLKRKLDALSKDESMCGSIKLQTLTVKVEQQISVLKPKLSESQKKSSAIVNQVIEGTQSRSSQEELAAIEAELQFLDKQIKINMEELERNVALIEEANMNWDSIVQIITKEIGILEYANDDPDHKENKARIKKRLEDLYANLAMFKKTTDNLKSAKIQSYEQLTKAKS